MNLMGAAIDRITGTGRETLPHRLVRGGVAGLIGTLAMTPVAGIGAIGQGKSPAPAQITANVERVSGVAEPPRDDPAFTLQWVAAHLAFGTSWGAGFGLARPLLPSSEVVAGLLWGGAIWVLNYGLLLPALGLYPSPANDRTGRRLAMIVAHAVYGVTVATTAHALG